MKKMSIGPKWLAAASIAVVATAATVLAAQLQFTNEQLKLPGKRGACFCLRDPAKSQNGTWDQNLPRLAKIQPYWNYSWGADYISMQEKYIKSEFVPMIWSAHSAEKLDETMKTRVVPEIKKGNIKRILGYNEPDGKEQANMTPEEALKLWPKLEKLGIPLCSPSAVHADREWMKEFMDGVATNNYRVDYIGVHSYGGTSAEAFKKRMQSIYELNGKRPLLITEFAVADWNTKGDFKKNKNTPAKVLAFAKSVLPWMEEQDWIAGYAWFSFGITSTAGYTSALLDDDGNLTALGRYYASVTTENPKGDQTIEPDDADVFLAKAIKAAKENQKK